MGQKPEKIVIADGTIEYRLNDVLHRLDGPAIEWAGGHKEWYFEGRHHREDGPAIERADGGKVYFLFGKVLDNPEDYEAAVTILRFIQTK